MTLWAKKMVSFYTCWWIYIKQLTLSLVEFEWGNEVCATTLPQLWSWANSEVWSMHSIELFHSGSSHHYPEHHTWWNTLPSSSGSAAVSSSSPSVIPQPHIAAPKNITNNASSLPSSTSQSGASSTVPHPHLATAASHLTFSNSPSDLASLYQPSQTPSVSAPFRLMTVTDPWAGSWGRLIPAFQAPNIFPPLSAVLDLLASKCPRGNCWNQLGEFL